MSHRLIARLAAVRTEFYATRGALAFTLREWPALRSERELEGQTLEALHLAVKNVESTYTLRLFAEFEAILREQYPVSRPGRKVPTQSDSLINGLGSHYKIAPARLQNVHRVRRFRHSVAHAGPAAEPITFPDALSHLNWFLSFIPSRDVR